MCASSKRFLNPPGSMRRYHCRRAPKEIARLPARKSGVPPSRNRTWCVRSLDPRIERSADGSSASRYHSPAFSPAHFRNDLFRASRTSRPRSVFHGADNTTRKPTVLTLSEGESLIRAAERQSLAVVLKAPPRNTRSSPVGGPVGSMALLAVRFVNQSWHHSHTLPAMS